MATTTNLPPTFNRLLRVTTFVALTLLAGVTFAQPRPDGGRGGLGGGPYGFGVGGPLDLLQRPDVQTELELLDEQKDDLSALAKKVNERRRELISDFSEQFRNRDGASDVDRLAFRKNFEEAFSKLHDETEQGLSFLLPHQRKRLSQLEIQYRMRGGAFGTLALPELGEQLGMTDAQRETLRTKTLELGLEWRKKMAELRREIQDKLLAELTPEQRAKFQEMHGDPFEFQDRPLGGGLGTGQPGGGGQP